MPGWVWIFIALAALVLVLLPFIVVMGSRRPSRSATPAQDDDAKPSGTQHPHHPFERVRYDTPTPKPGNRRSTERK